MTLKTLAEGELSKHIPKEKRELSARRHAGARFKSGDWALLKSLSVLRITGLTVLPKVKVGSRWGSNLRCCTVQSQPSPQE
jgi:hypothetical protein